MMILKKLQHRIVIILISVVYGQYLLLHAPPSTTECDALLIPIISTSSPKRNEKVSRLPQTLTTTTASSSSSKMMLSCTNSGIANDDYVLPNNSNIPSPTEEDSRMESWYRTVGIRGISRLSLRTTDRSVGGRGLFLSTTTQSKRAVFRGEIVAHIPATLVLTKSNYATGESKLRNVGWPIVLTALAFLASSHDDNILAPWIRAWGDGGVEAPISPDNLNDEKVQNLAALTGVASSIIREASAARHDTYLRDSLVLKRILDDDFNIDVRDDLDNDRLVASLYSVILSRTANLGQEWNNQRGVIPLHDMINHCEDNSCIELMTVGDVKRFTDINKLWEQSEEFLNNNSKRDNDGMESVKDRDILLVASRDILPGDELFLNYRQGKTGRKVEDEEKAWLSLQYGFPIAK